MIAVRYHENHETVVLSVIAFLQLMRELPVIYYYTQLSDDYPQHLYLRR